MRVKCYSTLFLAASNPTIFSPVMRVGLPYRLGLLLLFSPLLLDLTSSGSSLKE